MPPQQIPASRPPEHFEMVRMWVLDSSKHLSGLRAELHQELTGAALPEGLALARVPEKMVLVASELATNALRHGIPPTQISLSTGNGEFLLDVADHDVSRPPVVVDDRGPGDGGLGLQIALRLSVDVGWYMTEDTKHVWATFPRSDTAAA